MTGDGPYPFRVAAIDVGSNAIRFSAAEFVSPGYWVDLEVQRVPVRLGHQTFVTGHLDERAMQAAVESMSTFRRALDTHGISRYRAVATSAVREARNGSVLVDRIRRECGIQLETITGTEEARLVWLSVRARVDLRGKRWLAMDLGGGSLEVSLLSEKGILWTESHTMGTVRLLEDLGGVDADPEQFRRLLAEYTGTLRLPDRVDRRSLAGIIATGGNMDALASIAGCVPDDRGVSVLPVTELDRVIRLLSTMSTSERVERLGLREDRADVILPAGLIYRRVAELGGATEITVPHVGVKEGVLLDLADDIVGPAVHATRLEQSALQGALGLGRRFQLDEPHARHVARLSLSLFDQLTELHGLGPDDRRILLVAAVLHDAGQFISYRKHHKHSLYLIHNSDLPGISPAQRPVAALVARYHRRAEPKPEHFLFETLSEEDRERVRRLGAILRVADALDREHLQRVARVRAERLDTEVVIEVEGHGELLLEHWAFRKKAQMFTSVFGLPIRLQVSATTVGPSVI